MRLTHNCRIPDVLLSEGVQTGLSYDELLDKLLDAEKNDYVCTVQCPSS